jgi:DNA-binding NarL/FixJ family response regulator
LDVVGTTGDGAEVVDLVEATHPDVLLLDLGLPRKSGFDCLRELRERAPQVKVIVLSGSDDPASIDQALELGAICFIGKRVEPADLAATVRMAATDQPIYRRGSSGAPPRRRAAAETALDAAELTRREKEILRLVSEGHSNAKLAKMLWVTEQTVKFHLSNIYRKLDVENRTQAAAKARHLGFTDAVDEEQAETAT